MLCNNKTFSRTFICFYQWITLCPTLHMRNLFRGQQLIVNQWIEIQYILSSIRISFDKFVYTHKEFHCVSSLFSTMTFKIQIYKKEKQFFLSRKSDYIQYFCLHCFNLVLSESKHGERNCLCGGSFLQTGLFSASLKVKV